MGRRGVTEIKQLRRVSASTPSPCLTLLGFLMTSVLATTATVLLKFKSIGRGLLILSRYIITILAVGALQYNIIARHKPSLFS
jgi:hypothetical protein